MDRLRTLVQVIFTAASNAYAKGFVRGALFTGSTKQVCVPGLNCYSCPGALGACPVGALQAVSADRNWTVPFYALGFILAFGAMFGRAVCGWLCPFGLVQDLLHKIPLPFKRKHAGKKGTVAGTEEGSGSTSAVGFAQVADRWLRYVKYLVLALLVILLPMTVVDVTGLGEPWFCKWLCPSGTLMAGWPWAIIDGGIRQTLGFMFAWKSVILIILLVLSIVIYRPFCRYLCPLGAAYGLLNKVSLTGFAHDETSCTHCGACRISCPMGINPMENPNSTECIRCGRCLAACDTGALHKKRIFTSEDKGVTTQEPPSVG